jgi:hypothetical protein
LPPTEVKVQRTLLALAVAEQRVTLAKVAALDTRDLLAVARRLSSVAAQAPGQREPGS